VVVGITSAVAVIPIVYLILYLANWLLRLAIGQSPQEHPITQLMQSHPRALDLVVAGWVAIVAAPILEEILFRGVLQPWFRKHIWGGDIGMAGALFLAVYKRWPEIQTKVYATGWSAVWPELMPAAFVLVMV